MAGAWIEGRPVALADAAAEAARLIVASRMPVIAGLGTDIAGARAAIALADRVGGAIDHMHSDAVLRNLDVLRESGMMITTPNEARLRGDVVLLVGTGLAAAWPDLTTRLIAAPLAPEGVRRVIWLCPGKDELGPMASPSLRSFPRKRESRAAGSPLSRGRAEDGIERIGRNPRDLPTLLAALRARVAGRPAGKVSVSAKALDALAADLKAGKFGVTVWSAADLDALTIEMLCGLVKDLNGKTRFTGLPLSSGDNAFGVLQACGWMTGFPMRTGFARGYPEHDPWRFDARRLIESGEADCLVYIATFERAISPVYDPAVTTIALCGPDTSERDHAQVRIQIGRPGLDHDAVDHCADIGTLVHVKARKPSDAISVADAIAAIAAHLPERGAWPC
jgi:formylmethanofuran dehydrogenase subunit B